VGVASARKWRPLAKCRLRRAVTCTDSMVTVFAKARAPRLSAKSTCPLAVRYLVEIGVGVLSGAVVALNRATIAEEFGEKGVRQ